MSSSGLFHGHQVHTDLQAGKTPIYLISLFMFQGQHASYNEFQAARTIYLDPVLSKKFQVLQNKNI